MKIGVVCEGPTDFFAVECFFKEALLDFGISLEIISLQPNMDNTRPDGGWAAVLTWLNQNDFKERSLRYLNGGLFSNNLSKKSVDAIIIQMDTDIIGEQSFENFIDKHYGIRTNGAQTPQERSLEIRKILQKASQITQLSDTNKKKHIICPAVESTEAWCIIVFNETDTDINACSLRDQDLINAFGKVFSKYKGIPEEKIKKFYSSINKNQRSRKDFCEKSKSGVKFLIEKCDDFKRSVEEIINLNN